MGHAIWFQCLILNRIDTAEVRYQFEWLLAQAMPINTNRTGGERREGGLREHCKIADEQWVSGGDHRPVTRLARDYSGLRPGVEPPYLLSGNPGGRSICSPVSNLDK